MNVDFNKLSADMAGELLRELTFKGGDMNALGCYENFDLREGFKPFVLPDQHILLDFGSNDEEETNYGVIDPESHAGYEAYDNGEWWVIYQWDGDGTLVFAYEEYYYINTDCKKSHGWMRLDR